MPRLGRLHIPGGCYHVMGRGLERRRIFYADADKQDFLTRLGETLARSGSLCLAWSVMTNHYHLLIRVGDQPLSKLMSPLLGGYAGHYNRRHRRSGYVFQNRYKSILCDADAYLLELVRYIHLNPLRAERVKSLNDLDRYPWTGHATLMGHRKQDWQSVTEVLSLFATRTGTARRRYREFIDQGLEGRDADELLGGGLVRSYGGWEGLKRLRKEHIHCIGDERILGESDFVEHALAEDTLTVEKATQRIQAGWDLDRLIHRVCLYCGVKEDRLTQKARANDLSLAKALICHWGSQELNLSLREIANRLSISQPATSHWVNRGGEYCREVGIDFEVIDS
ncbi:MAG: transposase [Candidatus Thiodiazotropha sp.]